MLQRVILLVFLVATVMVTGGCASGNAKESISKTQVEQIQVDAAGQTENHSGSGAQSSSTRDATMTNSSPNRQLGSSGNFNESSKNGDLIIKSENQVSAGSKQAMVDQLDKDVNNLMDSLNKLETVDDSDLKIE